MYKYQSKFNNIDSHNTENFIKYKIDKRTIPDYYKFDNINDYFMF